MMFENFHVVQARQSFIVSASDKGHIEPALNDTIHIDSDCGQESLSTLIQAVYAKKLRIDSSNALSLLAAADYLQVLPESPQPLP